MSGPGAISIVGIALVRNEDLYIGRVLRNALALCDRLLVADNGSTDHTWERIQEVARADDRVAARRITDTAESHRMILPYVGTSTWVFGVDGDEIYDPAGLGRLRAEITAGRYRDYWKIVGNVLNCTELDVATRTARGHLSPPSRSMTKLYNFGAFESWDGDCPERLHGGDPVLREGFSEERFYPLHERTAWDASPFRCLHLCFLRRSSQDAPAPGARLNIMEKRALRWWQRLGIAGRGGAMSESQRYKRRKYMRGAEVRADVSAFFPAS
jgi:glycosyltransferase involved in cell wall biosynthesis